MPSRRPSLGQTIEMVAGFHRERLVIAIRDYGHGIPKKEISQIVKPFYMLDKARSRKAGGAGLGLALCVEIARLHGAELKIQSAVGKGTMVQIVFRKGAAS